MVEAVSMALNLVDWAIQAPFLTLALASLAASASAAIARLNWTGRVTSFLDCGDRRTYHQEHK